MKPQSTKTPKKDLLVFERQVYKLRRDQQGKTESIVSKMLNKPSKPQIGFLPRSSLLSQLDQFMPLLKQSNQQLLKQQVPEGMKFDAKLQQVQDSSESEESDEEVMAEQSSMQKEESTPQIVNAENPTQFQLNILTYPYEAKTQVKKQEKKAKVMIEQMDVEQSSNIE